MSPEITALFNALSPQDQTSAVSFMLFLREQDRKRNPRQEMDSEKIEEIAQAILQEYAPAFEELAK